MAEMSGPVSTRPSVENAAEPAGSRKNTPFFRRFPPSIPASALDPRCCISDERRFVYFRVPKAANTAVTANLYHAEHGRFVRSEVHRYKTAFRRPTTLSESEVADFENRYLLFAVVRSPYTRFLSVYLQRILKAGESRTQVAEAIGYGSDEEISVERFLSYLEEGGLSKNVHWCRQVDLVPVGVPLLHEILRTETLTADLPRLLSRIYGRPIEYQEFKTRHVTNAHEKVDALLTSDQGRRIHALYREDFDQLNYSSELEDVPRVR